MIGKASKVIHGLNLHPRNRRNSRFFVSHIFLTLDYGEKCQRDSNGKGRPGTGHRVTMESSSAFPSFSVFN